MDAGGGRTYPLTVMPKPPKRGGRPVTARPSSQPPASASIPAAAAGGTARVARVLESPASAIFAAFNDPSRRAWSPEPLYRVLSALPTRFVRLALPDGSQVAVSITRQGNARTNVAVEITGLADRAAVERATQRWRDGLGALAEQLDFGWD